MLTDWLGTKRAVVGADGQLSTAWCSLPFGNHLQQCGGSGTDPSDIHFTGKERDTESGNDYFGARYYASTTGRFLSPDWSAKVEPVPYAKLGPGYPLPAHSGNQVKPQTSSPAPSGAAKRHDGVEPGFNPAS